MRPAPSFNALQSVNQTTQALNEALANGDSDKIATLISSTSQALNTPVAIQIPPGPPVNNCPNQCSGRGTCQRDSTCLCNTGFATRDCSLTDEEVRQRQQVRDEWSTNWLHPSMPHHPENH